MIGSRWRFWRGDACCINDFKNAVIIEWTEEVLSSGIVMPDGTATTWGAAAGVDSLAELTSA